MKPWQLRLGRPTKFTVLRDRRQRIQTDSKNRQQYIQCTLYNTDTVGSCRGLGKLGAPSKGKMLNVLVGMILRLTGFRVLGGPTLSYQFGFGAVGAL